LQETILAVTFFAAITDDNLGSLVKKIMKDSMQKYDQNHKDHGVTKGKAKQACKIYLKNDRLKSQCSV
jgi:hypothetical protein